MESIRDVKIVVELKSDSLSPVTVQEPFKILEDRPEVLDLFATEYHWLIKQHGLDG